MALAQEKADAARPDPITAGCRRLLVAVLDAAHKDVSSRRFDGPVEVVVWFNSAEDRPPAECGHIAFQWVCAALGWDADEVRAWAMSDATQKVGEEFINLVHRARQTRSGRPRLRGDRGGGVSKVQNPITKTDAPSGSHTRAKLEEKTGDL